VNGSEIVEIFCDGASRGNPGPSAIGVVIKQNGHIAGEIYQKIPDTTNNVAEYSALIAGIERALALGAAKIAIFMDSELVVRQMEGRYKVKKEHLKPLHARALALLDSVKWQIQHIRREQNAEADKLANQALDS
jgi:ribonuclease HI